MRYRMTAAANVRFMLLLLLGIAAGPAAAQNQTPANVGSPGLMWTPKDNDADVDWNQASAYCANLRLGGNSDWRLPTIDELQGIYDPSIPGDWHVKGNLQLSRTFSSYWSSSPGSASGEAWYFAFYGGSRLSDKLNVGGFKRAFCVRRSGG